MDTHKFDGGEIALIEDNILLIEYDTAQLITTRNIFNFKNLKKTLLGNQSFYTITDARNGHLKISDDAKSFLSEENKSTTKRYADAILVDSLAKKIEVELYILFHKPKVKTKSFTELNKAIRWINSIKIEKESTNKQNEESLLQ